jgi:hypothetical protein
MPMQQNRTMPVQQNRSMSMLMQQNRFTKSYNRKEKLICSHCGIPSHTVDKCYKLHRYPPIFQFTKRPPPTGFAAKPSAHSVVHPQEEISYTRTQSLPQLPFTAE